MREMTPFSIFQMTLLPVRTKKGLPVWSWRKTCVSTGVSLTTWVIEYAASSDPSGKSGERFGRDKQEAERRSARSIREPSAETVNR